MASIDIQEQIKIEQRKYKKAWREKNPEKVKKHQADYWRRKAEKAIQTKQAKQQPSI